MIHFAHIGLAVSDLQKSKEFYSKALTPLGISMIKEKEQSASFGRDDGRTMLWLRVSGDVRPTHFAFEAETRDQVDQFYKAALSGGGKDNGAPGVRENYSSNYYAAFVFDPDGHNVEVVCRN